MSWGLPDLAAFLTGLGVHVVDSGEEDELLAGFSGDTPDLPRPTLLRLVSARGQDERMLLVDVTYPFTAPVVDDARLAGALLSPHLVLGHTEVDDDGSVHHRYAMVLDTAGELPAAVLTQVVAVLDYEQVHFGDYLEAVCVGGARLDLFAELIVRGEESGIT
ncbi:hypothetical protein [Nocardioides sp. W7]|uniref:hypothetical protein n=1 Tax=Nocardioides sp. W7 TaxID=2931390 RepID=UPI001FD2564F|nr:hypothetical protein [Nocardioides sp. W7]